MTLITYKTNPQLDLVLERIVDVPKELVWKAWTTPEYLKKWFTPAPVETVDCEIDLRPGGIFKTIMRMPDGQEMSNAGCYLEVVENEKLVWTSALDAGYRPAAESNDCFPYFFTATILLESHPTGTKYTAIVLHGNEEGCKKHAELGFYEGWGKALDQLVEFVKNEL